MKKQTASDSSNLIKTIRSEKRISKELSPDQTRLNRNASLCSVEDSKERKALTFCMPATIFPYI